jgi:hypothetical protein
MTEPVQPKTTSEKKTVYIYYYDDIDAGRVKTIMALVSGIIAQEKPTTLYFLFASRGGKLQLG